MVDNQDFCIDLKLIDKVMSRLVDVKNSEDSEKPPRVDSSVSILGKNEDGVNEEVVSEYSE